MARTVVEQRHLNQSRAERKKRHGWRELLGRWALQCPQCNQTWLVASAQNGDSHICRDCGHRFAVERS